MLWRVVRDKGFVGRLEGERYPNNPSSPSSLSGVPRNRIEYENMPRLTEAAGAEMPLSKWRGLLAESGKMEPLPHVALKQKKKKGGGGGGEVFPKRPSSEK